MLKGPIPSHVDPRKLADRAAILEGELPFESLPRFSEPLADKAGVVRAKFVFERAERRAAVIRCELDAEVKMVCQRCLELAVLPVHVESSFQVVKEGATDITVPKGYEALEVGEELLDLLTLAEDELLLALPIVPLHSSEDCQQLAGFDEPDPEPDEVSRSNPFSVLAQLKRDPNV
ncbi:YceD family protein [Pseudomonas sp. N040]|uniref:YceD family protein n=1 Tax=Pseudomonas sp. N040 TaxID=2785325 RepID=UPI0018A2664C|nr:YceD family protein [Pseudomonas sp. N040]MBF7731348.1 DUF177 domain-containing protein [Pseudomonas sp. N040]MBW7014991.1 YceD family protein [Pseudomonas sp. N040]